MRKVAHKIWLGSAVIVLLATFAMVMAFRATWRVEREMNRLVEVQEPLKAAAHEMEINIKGVALGTLAYLSAPNPAFRTLAEDAESDFAQFQAEYERLAVTEPAKQFGERIRRLFEQFCRQGRDLKAQRDRQAKALQEGLTKLEAIDRIFDQQLPTTLSRRRTEDQAKLEDLSVVDEGIDAIRMRVALYRWKRQAGQSELVRRAGEECRAAFDRLKTYTWANEGQGKALLDAEVGFENAFGKVREVLADEDALHVGIARFVALRKELDDLLDEEVQPLAAKQLLEPIVEAEKLTNAVVLQMGWLIALFLVAAVLASAALTRTVTHPLRRITQAAETVGLGNLDHRVPVVSRDEFATLAQAFNQMLARLHETLVSKESLEKSEQELQMTVRALQREISERVQSEANQRRLEVSLRRSERLAAMGTLVAGVAHQVRNPIFGMTSVLDAMEARLGQREEYRRYLEVLRGEAARMTRLMHDLMEYGRLSPRMTQVESTGNGSSAIHGKAVQPLMEVIREAVGGCRLLAEKARVTIIERSEAGTTLARADRLQLGSAFQNMLENAIQHSSPGSTVSVSAKRIEEAEGAWIEVLVEDCGTGFRPEDLPYVFEPFFTRREGGTGLGLALVERIIENHGGQVSAANRPGGGAVLTVRLPVALLTPIDRVALGCEVPMSGNGQHERE